MSFLAPAFLAGLAALAVPVLVHLTQRSRTQVTPFPSLLFLRRLPSRTTRRRRIRHPLLFALRCLAVALVVLAFARPAIDRSGAAVASAEGRDVVILLDRSMSMHGDRWARAVDAARATVDGLAEGERAALVLFDERAEEAVSLDAGPERLRAALAGARPGAGGTRYDPAVRLAVRTLGASARGRREVVLVTDFQRAGWPSPTGARLPPGIELSVVDVAEGDAGRNLAVAGASFRREGDGGRTAATVRVTNAGSEPASAELSLEVGGRVLDTRRASVAPRGAATVAFAGLALPEGAVRGAVRMRAEPAGADGLAADDTLRFVLAPDREVDVVVVEGAPTDRSLYLRRALAIGEAPPFRVRSASSSSLGTAAVGGADLVVLYDAEWPRGAAGEALVTRVEEGLGLLVLLGPGADARRWPASARALLPGEAGEVVDRPGDGGALAGLDLDHPALEPFREPGSGDFTRARVLRHRAFRPDTAAAVPMRLEDGSPALVEGRRGEGRVLVFTTTLDRYWNDLALQPVFLPFVQRLARHAAGWEERRPWRTVGDVLDVSEPEGAAAVAGARDRAGAGGADEAGEWIVVSPAGERRRAGAAPTAAPGEGGAGGEGAALVRLDEPGFWELRPAEAAGAASAGSAVTVAVNPDPAESDLTRLDPEELATALTSPPAPAGGEGSPAEAGTSADPEEGAEASGTPGTAAAGEIAGDSRPLELWPFLLLLALGTLAAEALLANRLSERRPGRATSALRRAA